MHRFLGWGKGCGGLREWGWTVATARARRHARTPAPHPPSSSLTLLTRPTLRPAPAPFRTLPHPPAPSPLQVWSGAMAWLVHLLVAKAVLRAMALPASVPWVELAAYTGYTFVPVCVAILAGQAAGRWAYLAAWGYGSLCSAIFLVRTMKRVIFQETRGYGELRGLRAGCGAGWVLPFPVRN